MLLLIQLSLVKPKLKDNTTKYGEGGGFLASKGKHCLVSVTATAVANYFFPKPDSFKNWLGQTAIAK